MKEERPWGYYEVLHDGEDCKLKRITVNSGGRLSLQYHFKRDEFWRVKEGVATVTINEEVYELQKNDYIQISRGTHHRVENKQNNPLVFIETQTGEYFGEDDIVRLQDDYNRA